MAAKNDGNKKLHIEIERDVLKRLEKYVNAYNAKSDRMTRRMKKVDVINRALAAYLQVEK